MINVYNFIKNNVVIMKTINNDNPIMVGKAFDLDKIKTEKFIVMCYKNNKCIGVCLMSNGNENSANVSYDKITNAILLLNADEFKILHNHPSGVLEASNDDKRVNSNCIKLATHLNVKFTESFIINNNLWYETLSERRS